MSKAKLDEKSGLKLERPRRFQVALLNDDFTPMDFVIAVLMQFFGKNAEDALALAMEVHRNGRGVAGTYTLEIAETKVGQTMDLAKAFEFPLLCRIQEA